MEKILLIIRTLDSIVEMIEILYPEKGQGKNKLEQALILFAEMWNGGEELLATNKDKIVAVIGKLVQIKNLLKWGRKEQRICLLGTVYSTSAVRWHVLYPRAGASQSARHNLISRTHEYLLHKSVGHTLPRERSLSIL